MTDEDQLWQWRPVSRSARRMHCMPWQDLPDLFSHRQLAYAYSIPERTSISHHPVNFLLQQNCWWWSQTRRWWHTLLYSRTSHRIAPYSLESTAHAHLFFRSCIWSTGCIVHMEPSCHLNQAYYPRRYNGHVPMINKARHKRTWLQKHRMRCTRG